MRNKEWLRPVLVLMLLWSGWSVIAQDFPAVSNRLVNDYTQTLSSSQVAQLEQKLVALDDSTSTQIAVVIIKSVGSYDIADYGVRLAQQWGIGGKEHDNGILLLVAIGDRQVTIQTGYGLEGAVPDIIAHRIIENEIKPAFRREDYYTGIDRATDAIISYTKGEYQTERRDTGGERGAIGLFILIVFIVLIIVLFSKNGGDNDGEIMGRRGVSDAFWWTMMGGMGSAGRNRGGGFGGGGLGGGGFGGGGFGGFGGGGFGGGGASGRW